MDNNTFFSFGAGTQSTAIALLLIYEPQKLIDLGLTLPKTIIFADTLLEPDYVYTHKEKMFELLQEAGYQTETVMGKRTYNEDPSLAPYFTKVLNPKGIGMLRRQCTSEWKIQPIERKVRELIGAKKGQRLPASSVNLWLGISCDEATRMSINPAKWLNNTYPLIKLGWNRNDCSIYSYYCLGYKPPKSSCYMCPYTHSQEWVRRKQHEPELFQKAVEFDQSIRDLKAFRVVEGECFIHRSGLPLEDAVSDQLTLPLGAEYGFATECQGFCGV